MFFFVNETPLSENQHLHKVDPIRHAYWKMNLTYYVLQDKKNYVASYQDLYPHLWILDTVLYDISKNLNNILKQPFKLPISKSGY